MIKSSHWRMLTLGCIGLQCLLLSSCKQWFGQGNTFPYASEDKSVQFILQESSTSQRKFYDIKSHDIDGRGTISLVDSASNGHSIIDSQIFGIKSTYESNTAPYPGFITQVIACETKKYIHESKRIFQGKETKLIQAVVSARRLFGVCSLEEIKFASLFWAGYDEQKKQVVTVELFKPVTDVLKISESQAELLETFKKVIKQ